MRNLDMKDLDLPRDTKIYINQSLCFYYRIFWSKAKRLQNIGSIDNFYVSSGTIKIKVTENSSQITITHHWMISRSVFLILTCHHRQMHRSLGFIISCVHGRYDISSSLIKSYAFDLFAFFFVCLLIHVCYNPQALFYFAFFPIIDFYWLSKFD